MERRIFQVDEKCFIIYTGKSSADDKSFLRIGNSSFISNNVEIQKHVRHIVVSDANSVDIKTEKENIRHMESGKIIYICNKHNQDLLFGLLRKAGVDTDNLYHKNLSKELENVNRLENKKHFFTIFYENKNVKLVFNEEIFFDLFSYKKEDVNYEEERERLLNFIILLDKLNSENRSANLTEEFTNITEITKLEYDNCVMFIAQDNQYFPLNVGNFKITRLNDNGDFNFSFNCSQRFYTGRELSLIVLERDEKKIDISDILLDSEVLESMVLYGYSMNFEGKDSRHNYAVLNLYKKILDRI